MEAMRLIYEHWIVTIVLGTCVLVPAIGAFGRGIGFALRGGEDSVEEKKS